MTALTVYPVNAASTTLTSAELLVSTSSGPPTGVDTTAIGTSTGWGEISIFGTSSAWAAAGSAPNPTGLGGLFDGTTLNGQTIASGNWSASATLSCSSGTISGSIVCRFYKYTSSGGTYTSLGSITLSSQTLTTTATAFNFPATSLAAASFVSGTYLYVDLVMHVTSTTAPAGATIAYTLSTSATSGNPSYYFATPGYSTTGTLTNRDLLTRIRLSILQNRDLGVRMLLKALVSRDLAARIKTAIAQDTAATGGRGSGNPGAWNPASDGESWTERTGAGTMAFTGTELTWTSSTVSATFQATLGTHTVQDCEGLCRVKMSAASDNPGIMLRWSSATNYYFAVLSGTQVLLRKDVAGSRSTIASASFTASAGSFYWIRFRAVAINPTVLFARVWVDGSSEPTTWNVTATDRTAAMQSALSFGVTGFTNVANNVVTFDSFVVTDAAPARQDLATRILLQAQSPRDIATRILLQAAPPPVVLTLVPTPPAVQDIPAVSGTTLPIFPPFAGRYAVNGAILADQPILTSAPFLQGITVPAGSVFTLLFSNPSTPTQTALASGASVSLTFALFTGMMVTGQVQVVSTLTGGMFQVTCTMAAPLTLNQWVVATQFL